MLRDFGERFGTTGPDGLIRHRLGPYAVTGKPDTVATAGRGTGYWYTYDVAGPQTGMLSHAPDSTMATRGGYVTSVNFWEAESFRRLVVFEGALIRSKDQAIFDGIAAALTGQPCARATQAVEYTP